MNRRQIISCIVFVALFSALSVYALRVRGWYPALYVLALQVAVYVLTGRRNLLTYSLSFIPALCLLFYLADKGVVFLCLAIAAALVITILFRVIKPSPRIKTQWWVSSLLEVEVIVFAALLAFA